jgi:plasmid rolling circle replication initiator protein Rep
MKTKAISRKEERTGVRKRLKTKDAGLMKERKSPEDIEKAEDGEKRRVEAKSACRGEPRLDGFASRRPKMGGFDRAENIWDVSEHG